MICNDQVTTRRDWHVDGSIHMYDIFANNPPTWFAKSFGIATLEPSNQSRARIES
jgi:hypothetical protein